MKLFTVIISIISIIGCFSCAFAQKAVQVKQIECDEQVIIRYDSLKGKVWGIATKFAFEFSHNYSEDLRIFDASYTHSEDMGSGVLLEIMIDGNYQSVPHPVNFKGRKYPNPGYYRSGVVHSIPYQGDIQDSLKCYAEIMREKGINSLEVGTLKEFKARHPILM